jgi:hypothetical protein
MDCAKFNNTTDSLGFSKQLWICSKCKHSISFTGCGYLILDRAMQWAARTCEEKTAQKQLKNKYDDKNDRCSSAQLHCGATGLISPPETGLIEQRRAQPAPTMVSSWGSPIRDATRAVHPV